MSTLIMSQCWPLQGFNPAQKAVLISLADNANDEGVCWPSVHKICERTCLSERAVQRAIKVLRDLKILKGEQRKGRSTMYTISVETHLAYLADTQELETTQPPPESHPRQSGTPDNATPTPRHSATSPPSIWHPTPVILAPRTVIETKGNHQKNRQVYSVDFEQFWQAYPKRAGGNPKQNAWRNWQRNLKEGFSPDQMIAAAERYRMFCELHRKTLTEYVKQAATFLNDSEVLTHPDESFPLIQRLSPEETRNREKAEQRERVQDIGDTSWADS